MNRRASVSDALPIMWVLFGMAMTGLVMGIVVGVVNTDFQADASVPTVAKTIMQTGATQFPLVMDIWFILFFIGLPLISAVLAYFDNVHPLFMWLSFLLVFVVVIVGAGIAQLWEALMEDTVLSTQAALMPITDYILSNFGLYSLFIFVIIAMGTFVKLRGRDAYGAF